jgi:tripartite-type tricarboxylate transporter receptor subunit TctC
MERRTFNRQLAFGGLAAACHPAAWSQSNFPIPGRPVRLIVSLPAGGGVDVVARGVGKLLAERLGVPVNVDNRPGANTVIAVQELVKAAPDGHTLLVNTQGFMTHLPHQLGKLPYEPFRDVVPVAALFRTGLVLAAHPSLPVQDANGLIAYARANPGKLSYASWLSGGASHVLPELLKRRFQLDMVHVPYNGIVKVHPDLLEGRVQLVLDATNQGFDYIRAGKLKGLGVIGPTRMVRIPEVPTFREQGIGIPGFDWAGNAGVFAPAGTPASVVEALHRDIAAAVASPDIARLYAQFSYEAMTPTAREYAQLLRTDHDYWGAILRELAIRLD